MNPLFLGLLIAGLALVIGVLLYNWMQERHERQRIEAALRSAGNLPGVGGERRIEPRLGPDEERVRQTPVPQSAAINREDVVTDEVVFEADELSDEPIQHIATPAPPDRAANAPDPDIECVVLLQPRQPVTTAALGAGLEARLRKPVRWLGRRAVGLPWQDIDKSTPGAWQEITACLLLANRSGAATFTDVETFLRLVAQSAAALPAQCSLPDASGEAARAEALDRFCADLDVQIGLTLLKADLGQIAGTRLRGVAEASGFRLNAGQFDYVQEETGTTLFSLQNYKQEQPFTPENLRNMSTAGVVLLLDVPRVTDPVKAFDQMRLIAKRMAQTLETALVDDNRRPLTDTALAAIRGEVQTTAAALRESHIDPGGPRALRLFG